MTFGSGAFSLIAAVVLYIGIGFHKAGLIIIWHVADALGPLSGVNYSGLSVVVSEAVDRLNRLWCVVVCVSYR